MGGRKFIEREPDVTKTNQSRLAEAASRHWLALGVGHEAVRPNRRENIPDLWRAGEEPRAAVGEVGQQRGYLSRAHIERGANERGGPHLRRGSVRE